VENLETVGSRAESRRFFTTIAKFEGHCWKDIVTPEILETYTPYHRETFIGQGPALLAIDGGPEQPYGLVKLNKSSCGNYCHQADAGALRAVRSLKIPIFSIPITNTRTS